MEDINVPKFVLEDILNTLRIVKNYSSSKGETCVDRCILRNIRQLNELLTGKKITGLEELNK